MGRYRRKGNPAKSKHISKARRTRRYKRDMDQIQNDLIPENAQKLTNQEANEELPGLGQNYCVSCARHFITRTAIIEHYKTKLHKKSVKRSKEEWHNEKDAEEFGKF